VNYINILLGFLCLSLPALADDTEIYGATAIDESNRVNSNVLFIMDTSGSMNGQVTVTTTPSGPTGAYDNSYDYSGFGSYDNNKVYHTRSGGPSNAGDPSDGNIKSSIRSSGDYNCSSQLTTLNSIGRVESKFKQDRYNNGNNWKNLQNNNNNEIRCSSNKTHFLYTGNYMNWFHATGGGGGGGGGGGTTTTTTRLQVVVDVVKHLTHSLSKINLGLMRFDRDGEGGMIDVPVTDIATSGQLIRDKLDSYYHSGVTPLSESLHEAARYYRGEDWIYGDDSTAGIINGDGWSEISYPSAATSRTSANSSKYKSPIESECQKNHVILLTDGQPYYDESSNTDIKNYVKNMALPSQLSKSCSGDGGCLDELAYWLKNTDSATTLTGNQDITLYTIGGFNLTSGVDLLTRAANFGGGRYYPADDTQGLIDALDAIFLDILATDSTFTAPAVSVNAFNASEHRDELFYALFRPADNVKWSGNLKKYRLLEDGMVVGTEITVPAISQSTGFFTESTFDYWNTSTTEPDGKDVTEGGMVNKLTADPRTRNLLSNFNNDDNQNLASYIATCTEALAANCVASKASFGISNYTDFTNAHRWSMGIDVRDENSNSDYTDSRQSIGDPLHSEPVIVTYGGTDENPVSNIFFGTNEGFLHSLDTVTGQESFAFIPKELHTIQKDYFDDTSAAATKPYGMDGAISTWFYDKNKNNVLYNSAGVKDPGEHVYLYAGMRRGGNNYYALDVSNRTTPTLKFVVEGGTGDFSKLGQTWSRMTPAKVKLDGADRFVLFFSGGYDTAQDSNTLSQSDGTGNAIYMVDAATGERLWWASSDSSANLVMANMVNSIPANISAVDITGDGYINYLFAADTGGRVFRIDLNPSNTNANNFAIGGMIASLAGSDAASNRRFYNKPNVALVKDKQYGDYLTISIGSGHRAHPIQTTAVSNRFYVIKDTSPYQVPPVLNPNSDPSDDDIERYSDMVKTEASSNSGTVSPTKLYNATTLMKGTINYDDIAPYMNNGGGWYVTFDTSGEKVLAESTTFSGAIIFTTFSPTASNTTTCGADTGTSRIYAINQKSATASIDLDGDGNKESSKLLAHSGIAPRPVVIYRKGGGKTIAIGTETINDDRFEESDPDESCEDDNSCGNDVKKCEENSCNVTPVYWRQNDI